MSGIANDHPRDRLSPYFDDELQVDERAAVDRHLARCPECRDELEAMQRMAAAFASEPVPEMAEDLEVRVLHRLDLATILPLRRRSFFVPASIAATVAAVGLVSVIVWKQGGVAPLSSTTESAQEREQTAEPEPPSGTRVQQAPALEGAPGGAPADKLEPSKKNEIATNAPAAPPPAPDAASNEAAAPAAPEELVKLKADARQDDADADAARQRALGYVGSTADTQAKEAYAPVPGRDERTLARMAAKPSSPVVAGASGGTFAPACAGGTFDASDEGRWSVADLSRGLDDLRTVLGAVGGRLESFEPRTTRRAAVVIPRERYAEWIRAAKLQGVSGLADEFPDGDGDCVRQQIRIEQPQQP